MVIILDLIHDETSKVLADNIGLATIYVWYMIMLLGHERFDVLAVWGYRDETFKVLADHHAT